MTSVSECPNRSCKSKAAYLILVVLSAPAPLLSQGSGNLRLSPERPRYVGSIWESPPRAHFGFIIGYDNNMTGAPIIWTIDESGRRAESVFSLPEAARIFVYDASVAPNGDAVIVGGAFTDDIGVTTFLARIDRDRPRQVVTRTWPYCPWVVTVAPDGSSWAVGRLKDSAGATLTQAVLRHFDPQGRTLSTRELSVLGSNPVETSSLSAARDRIGWLTTAGEYIEFSTEGGETARFTAPSDVRGLALGDDGMVMTARKSGKGMELLVLDRTARRWRSLALPELSWTRVLGMSQDTLITSPGNGTIQSYRMR